ncbi:hypothetical protein HDZ31DRAFT_67485 [Schizophyllum fasciatum]
MPFVEVFFAAYMLVKEQILATNDAVYLLVLCCCQAEKPVPFIPVPDNELSSGFRSYGNDESKVPVVDNLAARPKSVPSLRSAKADGKDILQIGAAYSQQPAGSSLVGSKLSWLRALITSKTICTGMLRSPTRHLSESL